MGRPVSTELLRAKTMEGRETEIRKL
jgi:hypothetical protein